MMIFQKIASFRLCEFGKWKLFCARPKLLLIRVSLKKFCVIFSFSGHFRSAGKIDRFARCCSAELMSCERFSFSFDCLRLNGAYHRSDDEMRRVDEDGNLIRNSNWSALLGDARVINEKISAFFPETTWVDGNLMSASTQLAVDNLQLLERFSRIKSQSSREIERSALFSQNVERQRWVEMKRKRKE